MAFIFLIFFHFYVSVDFTLVNFVRVFSGLLQFCDLTCSSYAVSGSDATTENWASLIYDFGFHAIFFATYIVCEFFLAGSY